MERPTTDIINIIRDLYHNSNGGGTSDEQNRIIQKVDKEFESCDNRIDKYIRNSSKDLSNLIKVFNDIAKKIELSRANVSHSRDALKQCKILLQSKKDDVRRLWLDDCEQKFYYDNLIKLKQLYLAGENIRLLCNDKNYLEAAQLISDSTRLLNNEYREVAGLQDVKRNIDNERIKLESFLYKELTDQLYTTVTKSVLETGAVAPVREASFKRRFRHHLTSKINEDSNETSADSLSALKQNTNEAIIERLVQAAAKLNNPENNINIVEKMINDVNKNIVQQLIQMVNSTSTHVVESNLIDNSKLNYNYSNNSRQTIENNPKFLCQLIDLSFEQFKTMTKYYRLFIEYSSKANQNKYQSSLIWTCVQSVLIQLLEEYLDIKQMGQSASNSSADMIDKMDINSFFAKKRLINLAFGTNEPSLAPAAGQNQAYNQQATSDDSSTHRIFTFKGSSHAMSITNYIKEQNNEDLFSNDEDYSKSSESANQMGNDQRVFKILVCQPDHRNITTIFSTMEHIIKEIADEIRNLPAADNQQKPDLVLDKFLQEFILKTFITNAVESIKENARIHNQSDGKFEISKQLISLAKQRELGLNKPILQNILHVYQSCMDLYNLIKDMNSYASEFSKAMFSLIEKHIDYCNKLFLSIVTNSTDEAAQNSGSFVYSMVWVMDEGIKRYFKQLPAFSFAIKGKPSPAAHITMQNAAKQSNTNYLAGLSSINNITVSSATTNFNSLNPNVLAATVELEQTNFEVLSKEVETLISNLNDKELEEVDIITNFNYIEMIAHLHESSDWLIVQLRYIVSSLEQMVKNPKSLNNSLSIGELNRLLKQLDDLDKWRGDTLLLLYLETRVHCFYHLLNFIKQENNTSYAGDIDTGNFNFSSIILRFFF